MDNRKSKFVKKFSALMLILSIVFALSGCLRYEIKTEVHTDGTADISFTYAVADVTGKADTSSWANMAEKFTNADWDVEDYSESAKNTKYAGFVATRKGVELDSIEDEMKKVDAGNLKLTEDDGEYTLEWDISSGVDSAKSQGVTSDYLEQYEGYMKFVLELPGKVIKSNGEESKGGKHIEWNLFDLKDSKIEATFNLKSSGSGAPIGLILGIVGGVVAVAAIVVVILLVMKKKKNAPAPVDPMANFAAAPQAPVVPQQAPVVPQMPVAPQQAPVAPQIPVAPQAQVPVAPQVPQAPVAPQAPIDPQNPGNPTV